MIRLPEQQQIKDCRSSPWDFGDSVLYKLCEKSFDHKQDEKIAAKVWLIGRAYSVAIERGSLSRKSKKQDIDDFYINTVAPTIRKSQLDAKLSALKKYEQITNENAFEVLEVHGYLTKELYTITGLNKRSFSSKYLHFHLPDLFFIYDSRALAALRQFITHVPRDLRYLAERAEVDKEYATFTCKCLEIKSQISRKYDMSLTNRQLDNLLLAKANHNPHYQTIALLN